MDPGNGVSSAVSMARGRPIRNSEEMMDVLAEDIFRYERLAEQAGELESVQEVECPKDNLDYSGRFVHFTEGDAEEFIAKNVKKNTKYKTSSNIKLFKEFFDELREVREPETIPPKELDNYIARFILSARPKSFNETKKEYEPDTLTSMHNSIDRYLKEKKVEFRYKFYLRPLDNPKSQIWFSHQSLGKDKLGQKMKDLANKGNLQGRKVNYSARKTFASTLIHSKVPPTEVAQLGGWKNVGIVNNYSVPSMEQQEIASNILSDVVA
ncbi:hypothetical protein KUTeg_023208 [Tegillarca granosa]|uniref:Tyr recombinase domain-containing protein n=1 Tax=Tegillarca granosa TaxID=220873 RepID=A0ABQ9E116_TEGGR|nr:hypothetical protein KUTeg_023208 [Tegillarca granosa]